VPATGSRGFGELFGHAAGMAESHFDEWIAERYHLLWPELFEPSVVQPAVEVLATSPGQAPLSNSALAPAASPSR
jgi:hypothetical protein